MAYYKTEKIDKLMKEPAVNPRLAGLARNVLMHYLGENYDPKTFNPLRELSIRDYIYDTLQEKIKTRKPYHWVLIDYVFREMFKTWNIQIQSDQALKRKIRIWERKDSLHYADELIEEVMNDKKSYPRYRHLARKALKHYLGNLYDPKITDFEIEARFRFYIKGFVEDKVFENDPYDWPVIDNFFRFVLNYEGYRHITYDQSILDKGYNGVFKGDLPKHYA